MANESRKKNRSPIGVRLLMIILIVIGFVTGYITCDDIIEFLNQSGETTQEVQTGQQTIHLSPDDALIVTMLDVGQADSFLIQQGNHYALIDCGTRSSGDDVSQYLSDQGITTLDYIIGTHPHDDHMGGMEDVVKSVSVGQVLIPEVPASLVTSNWYLSLRKELKNSKYDVVYPHVGEGYELGKATLWIIGPIEYSGTNVNNYSIVIKLSFGEQDIIFTGDAEAEIEKQIIDSGAAVDAEVLKVGHHGSDTSNTEAWITAISPDYALISTKVGNKYSHPIKSTMDRLKAHNIVVYRTDECGMVIMTITADSITFSTKPGDYRSGEELERSN